MASKKQLAWRKKFAKMAKAGKFKKSKKKKTGIKASLREREYLENYGYTKAEIDKHFKMRKLEKKRVEMRDRPEFNPDVREERERPDTGDW